VKTVLVAAVWVLLLAAAGSVALHLWFEIGEVSLGFHGWLALGLGVGFSLILGVGLMMLVFHSARRGYDDAGGPPDGGAPGGEREKDGDDAQR
jgi:hypothetical protein